MNIKHALCSAVILTTLGFANAGIGHAQTDITKTDWKAVLLADPKLKRTADEPLLIEKYFRVSSRDKAEGYAIFDSVVYGDLTGDGQPEAIIPLASGGTAGDIGMLLYRLDRRGKPELVLGLTGYKMAVSVSEDELLVAQPQYAGWEGNCCPSALTESRYRLRGNRLARRSIVVTPFADARGPTLVHVFGLINAKSYRAAYAFLTPAEQRRRPFNAWKAEFEPLTELTVEGVTQSTSDTVIAIVRARTANGAIMSSATAVKMVWSARARQWLIDSATGNPLPANAAVLAGKLGFPSESLPAMTVVAREVSSGKIFSIDTKNGQGAYALVVEPGTYTVIAYLASANSGERDGGGFTAAVGCGLNVNCTDHALVPVTLTAGGVNAEADLTDWFAGENFFPGKP